MKKSPAVALIINSPGGSPVQAHIIYKRIRALAEENEKQVLIFVEDVAASGGYMIAVAGDEIIVDESSILGSIGVVSAGFGFDKAIERLGIDRRVYTAGQSKAILDPFQPEKKGDIAYLKSIQAEIHDHFKALVKGRRYSLPDNDKDIFSGRFWIGKKAIELGLADQIGDLKTVLKQRFGAETKLKLIEGNRGFLRKSNTGISLLSAAFDPPALMAAMEERALWARFGL